VQENKIQTLWYGPVNSALDPYKLVSRGSTSLYSRARFSLRWNSLLIILNQKPNTPKEKQRKQRRTSTGGDHGKICVDFAPFLPQRLFPPRPNQREEQKNHLGLKVVFVALHKTERVSGNALEKHEKKKK